MRISNKQRRAIEKVTGKHWDNYHPEAINAYFMFTDKGIKTEVPAEAVKDYEELIFCHRWHPVTVELWKKDFKLGLLFLSDFINQGYPDSYVKHAKEIHNSVMLKEINV